MPRLKSDLFEIFNAVIDEKLDKISIEWYDDAAACVVMASGGYPKKYTSGYEITGIDDAQKGGAVVFHAGTKIQDGKTVTAGGRVLGVTAMGKTLDEAIKNAYSGVEKIAFCDAHYRKDIGIK